MSGMPLKPPAYGVSLFKRRAAGDTPWLVIAAVGVPVDWSTFRSDPGVARIGMGAQFPYFRADFRCLMGLDVLVSFFGYQGVDDEAIAERDLRAIRAIWSRGQPGTLWTMQSGGACRVAPARELENVGQFEVVSDLFGLDGDFREIVERERRRAILAREGIFARPAFDAVRGQIREEENRVRDYLMSRMSSERAQPMTDRQ